MDPVRRLISGKKARFTDGELDLDLVWLTERVILMGFPAAGLASLYRNQRKTVHQFLDKYALEGKYKICSLCPRYENSYEADEFGGRVMRFPFPDHFPCPISLFPIYVHHANVWMNADPENLLIIHCKAGKGRSGSFGIAYLLAQPGLPSAPAVDEGADEEPSVKAIDPDPVPGTPTEPPMAEKVPALLDFHTKRRMAPGTTSRGVSISSQRRWLGYWGRMLEGRDPRPKELPSQSKMRQVRLEFVRIWGKGPSGVTRKLGGDRIAVQVFRYKDSIATELRERELALAAGGPDDFDDNNWDDQSDDMIVRVGGFTEADQRGERSPSPTSSGYTTDEGSPASASSPVAPPSPIDAVHASDSPRTLVPHTAYLLPSHTNTTALSKEGAKEAARAEGGILLDADREVQLKLLLGKSGRKHGALPAMAALGVLWFIPSFVSTKEEAAADGISLLKIDGSELDFLKPQAHIEAVEIGWRWVDGERGQL